MSFEMFIALVIYKIEGTEIPSIGLDLVKNKTLEERYLSLRMRLGIIQSKNVRIYL